MCFRFFPTEIFINKPKKEVVRYNYRDTREKRRKSLWQEQKNTSTLYSSVT